MAKQDLELSAVQSRIYDLNAEHYGVDMSKALDQTGKQISQKLIHRYGIAKRYGVICGLAGNGADGLSTASHLAASGAMVTLYLVGRATSLETQTAKQQWIRLKEQNAVTLVVKQDVFATDIDNHDVIVEALVGTGLQGKVTKRFRDVIKRISHFKQPILAIDRSIPGYKPAVTISINSPKTEGAEVVEIKLPADLQQRVGPGDTSELYKPRLRTHKLQNGRLLIWYGGDDVIELETIIKYVEEYHVEIKVYAPYAGGKQKYLLAEQELEAALCGADAVLCCKQLTTFGNKALMNYILQEFPNLTFVIDNSVLELVDVTEFLFEHNLLVIADKSRTNSLTRRTTAEQDIYVNIRGFQNLLWGDNPFTGQNEMRVNVPSERNELKLLGLSAAYATKNPLWLAMCAAEFNSGTDA